MNKIECKKYIRRAMKKLINLNKEFTPSNIAYEVEKQIKDEGELYIAYAKIAVHNLNKSATDITAKELEKEVDTIIKLYENNEYNLILRSKNL